MKCPSCHHRFKQLSSWPLALGRPVVCGECGTNSVRFGRWMPLFIAVGALLAFKQMIGMFDFTGIGTVLLLIGLVLLSMMVDEMTVTLRPIQGNSFGDKSSKDGMKNLRAETGERFVEDEKSPEGGGK